LLELLLFFVKNEKGYIALLVLGLRGGVIKQD